MNKNILYNIFSVFLYIYELFFYICSVYFYLTFEDKEIKKIIGYMNFVFNNNITYNMNRHFAKVWWLETRILRKFKKVFPFDSQ